MRRYVLYEISASCVVLKHEIEKEIDKRDLNKVTNRLHKCSDVLNATIDNEHLSNTTVKTYLIGIVLFLESILDDIVDNSVKNKDLVNRTISILVSEIGNRSGQIERDIKELANKRYKVSYIDYSRFEDVALGNAVPQRIADVFNNCEPNEKEFLKLFYMED